jgi:TPR repeat protein
MTLLRRGLRVTAAAVVTVAVGVAVNQVLNGGRWDVRWLAAAVVLAAVAEGLDVWLGRDTVRRPAAETVPVLWPGLAGEDGLPLPLSEVTPRDLGVHPSRFGRDGDSPYIPRTADGVLAAALAGAGSRVVIVQGPRLAGATSTLAQAAQSCLPDHLAAGFIDDPRVSLENMIAQAVQWAGDLRAPGAGAGAVVWLDGLNAARLVELARVPLGELPPGVWLLATLDSGELDGLRVPEQLDALLDRHAVRVELGAVNGEERRALLAEDAYAALRPLLGQQEDLFIGRTMVAWQPLRAALTRGGSEESADRVALLRAVTDWYRVGLPRLLNGDVLPHLYRAYRRELAAAAARRPDSASAYSDALRWATEGPTADRPRLIDLQDVPGGQQYAPHPLLAVLADDPGEAVAWRVSDALWSYADSFFDGDQRRDIGYTALDRGARSAAARLFSHTDSTVDPAAYTQLADLFYQNAEWPDTRLWFQQAIATSHTEAAPAAMFGLGVVEEHHGDPSQARHWYQQAIATGHTFHAPRAMVNLGYMEDRQGDFSQARHWFQQAIATGHAEAAPKAMLGLGVVEEHRWDFSQARHWYRQAIATGYAEVVPAAMFDLGLMEEQQGDLNQARHWFQQAIATGHTEAATAAQQELRALDRHQDERRRGEEFGHYRYLAYADPALMTPTGQPPTAPDPNKADDGNR